MVSWTEFKDIKATTGAKIFYCQVESDPDPDQYMMYLATIRFELNCNIEDESDVEDFEDNYKSAAQSCSSPGAALARAIAGTSCPAGLSGMVYEYTTYSPSNNSDRSMMTYEVTAGKTFFLIRYSVKRDSNNNKKCRFQVKVDTEVRDSDFMKSKGNEVNGLTFQPSSPVPFASGGETIDFRIAMEGKTSNNYKWAVVLIGYEV